MPGQGKHWLQPHSPDFPDLTILMSLNRVEGGGWNGPAQITDNFTGIIFVSKEKITLESSNKKLSYVSKTVTIRGTMSLSLNEGALFQATGEQDGNRKQHPINVKVTYQLFL